jgi:hypothetical protein
MTDTDATSLSQTDVAVDVVTWPNVASLEPPTCNNVPQPWKWSSPLAPISWRSAHPWLTAVRT